jgi:predicted HD superfamily hydrolase involved in NAD metabolism
VVQTVAEWAADRLPLLSAPRRRHSEAVAQLAADLAGRHGLSPEAAYDAGLVHDLAREWSGEALLGEADRLALHPDAVERAAPVLLHGPVVAAWMMRDGVGTPSIHEAVRYHTTAAPGLGPLGWVVFIADAVEPGRRYPQAAPLRDLAHDNLEAAAVAVMRSTLRYLEARGITPHPRLIEAIGERTGNRNSGHREAT